MCMFSYFLIFILKVNLQISETFIQYSTQARCMLYRYMYLKKIFTNATSFSKVKRKIRIFQVYSKFSFLIFSNWVKILLFKKYFEPFQCRWVGGLSSPFSKSNSLLSSTANDDLISPTPPTKEGPGW